MNRRVDDQVSSNKRRAALLVTAAVAVLFAVTGSIAAIADLGWAGSVAALVLSIAVVAALVSRAEKIALAQSQARPAPEAEFARLHNLVTGLCSGAGLPKPALFVVDDPAPNAFAIGRRPRHASVVVTTGTLSKLSRIELEGVLAHELSHIKHYDTLVSTLALALLGVVAPSSVRWVVNPRREPMADVQGVAYTRYPPGLIAALEKLRDDPATITTRSRAMAYLWIESPVHPPLDQRIEALREL